MDALGTVRRRLAAQRLTADPFDDAGEVVEWLGAVQAQVFDEAKWSLGERTRSCTDADVEAAFARGDIIRTHVLRPTWHFVARPDLRWLLRLTRPRVHGLNRYWYAQHGLDAKLFAHAHRVLAEALADGAPRTRTELAERLAASGIVADGPRLAYVLMHAELEEVICSGPRRGKQHTYALLDDRVPLSPRDELSRELAAAELVRRYFTSHGPATVKDFTTWSSLTVAETRAALERVGNALDVQVDEAGTAWYAAPPRGESTPRRGRTAFLIPMYDETIVAYQGLRVVLAQPVPRPGLLDRAIVIGGRTVGTWKRSLMPPRVTLEAKLFAHLAGADARALDGATRRFGRFLGPRGITGRRRGSRTMIHASRGRVTLNTGPRGRPPGRRPGW